MKAYKKQVLLSVLATLLPMLAGVLLWGALPEKVATHFTFDGTPDSWSSRAFVVFAMPGFLAAVDLLCLVFTLHDPKRENVGRKMLGLIFWMIPLIGGFTMALTYAYNLGFRVNMAFAVNLLLGLVFLVIGNYLGKTHQNYTVGIKLPWTLNSRENWNRTHRFGARCFVAGGLVLLVNAFLLSPVLMLLTILLCALGPALYSFVLYKKGI